MDIDEPKVVSNVIRDLLEHEVKRYLKFGLVKTTEPLVKASHSSSADEIRALGKKHYAVCTRRAMERISGIFEEHRLLDKKRELDKMDKQQTEFKDQAARRFTGSLKHDIPVVADIVNTRDLKTEQELLDALEKRQEELLDQIARGSSGGSS